jgi:DNA-binding protein HU-beta
VNRRDLVTAVAHHTGRERKDVDEVLRGFTDVVTNVVAKGEDVAISGFAKFTNVKRPARTGRNPQTGEPVKIKATKKPKITPLKGFKDSVVKPSQAPKHSQLPKPKTPKHSRLRTRYSGP